MEFFCLKKKYEMDKKHLSIILVGRNDNYGGDFKSRLESCILWTYNHLTRNEIASEIIFVNYNPLSDTDILEFIQWPYSNKFVNVRIITVLPEIHSKIIESYSVKPVPVLEYFAKNVGIRRAKGHYILSMNPDILIDEKIFNQLKKLDSGNYYRVNRCDYHNHLMNREKIRLFDSLKNQINMVWYKGRKKQTESLTMFSYCFLWLLRTIENHWKKNTVHFSKIISLFKMTVYYHNVEFKYHCNASGDFMLMSRENWLKIKGYKENSNISLHTDSLFVIQAAMSGIKEKVFFHPVYHKEHERRYDADKENNEQRVKYIDYQREAQRMLKQKKPIIYNDDNWGLFNFDIPETRL